MKRKKIEISEYCFTKFWFSFYMCIKHMYVLLVHMFFLVWVTVKV